MTADPVRTIGWADPRASVGAAAGPNPAQPAARPMGGRWGRMLMSAPDRVLGGFLATCLVVSIFLQLHQFRWWLVMPVTVIAVVLTRRWMPAYRDDGREHHGHAVLGAGIALALVAGFLALNIEHAAQWVIMDRDQSMYTLRGLWLVDHPSPTVSVRPETLDMARSLPEVFTDAGALPPSDTAAAWGASLLPGLIGLTGWFGGQGVALHAPVLIGTVALLGLYAAGRRLLGPLWALLPVVALGASMPMVAFSRAAFSEPTALVLFCGAAVCLWTAVEAWSWRMALLAGAFAGAITLARIDGPLVVIGGFGCLGLLALLAGTRPRRLTIRRMHLAFLAGSMPLVGLGYVDLQFNGEWYLNAQGAKPGLLFAATGVALALSILATVHWRAGRLLAVAVARHRRGVAIAVAILVGACALVMLSRPLWLTSHADKAPAYLSATEAVQRAAGQPVDGTRTYDEVTLNWHALYFGWALVLLGLTGAVLICWRTARSRNARLLAWVMLPGAAAALYLVRASVSVDQIWAMRRFLPEVIPGMLVLAALACQAAVRWLRRRWRGARFAVLVAVLAFLAPAAVWGQLYAVSEGAGLFDMARRICDAVPGHRVVFAAPPDRRGFGTLLPTLQDVCGADAVWLRAPTRENLAAIAGSWRGHGDISVVVVDPAALSWTGSPPPALDEVWYPHWAKSLNTRPTDLIRQQMSVWVGILQPDGSVAPLAQPA